MKRLYFSLILFAVVQGCMTSDGLGTLNMSEINVSNLSRIRVGMTEHEVYHIMDKPYQTRELSRNGDTYHVWFYVTNPAIMAQTEMVHQNLTPLTFKLNQADESQDYLLVNIGWDYYRALENNEQIGPKPIKPLIAPPAPPAPPNAQQQQQAKEIEDALKATPPITPQTAPAPDETEPKSEEEINLEKVLNTEPVPEKAPISPPSPAPVETNTTTSSADIPVISNDSES